MGGDASARLEIPYGAVWDEQAEPPPAQQGGGHAVRKLITTLPITGML